MKITRNIACVAPVLYPITLAWGFASLSAPLAFVHNHRPGTSRAKRFISLEDSSDFIPDDNNSSHSPERSIELWLDLRGTAIHPRAAIEYLAEQVFEGPDHGVTDFSTDVDRIIVSDKMFQKLLNSSDDYIQESEILYVPEETLAQIALSRGGLSFPFGVFVAMEGPMAVSDPITAMETLSVGQWVVLYNEEEEIEDEDSRIAAVGGFVEIASGDWRTTTQLESGLLLQTGSNKEVENSMGGVAVQCPTKSSILRLASMIESVVSGKSMTATESGILIHEETGEACPLPFALMLPFDVSLWKTALEVYGKQEEV
jgi:hypothetical protein